jgi:hypothetical protein
MLFPLMMSIRHLRKQTTDIANTVAAERELSGKEQEELTLWRFGVDIKNATPTDSIVLVPDASMVPIYYSERHLIRGIIYFSVLDSALPKTFEAFPQCQYFLALHPNEL